MQQFGWEILLLSDICWDNQLMRAMNWDSHVILVHSGDTENFDRCHTNFYTIVIDYNL